ncbi:DUF3971 domain-containing protein [Rickettsiales bacterium LUAb2]
MEAKRSIFSKISKIIIRLLNWIGILLTVILGIVLYIIIFEVPISFLNTYIEKNIFHNIVTIKKVYLRWDYSIKKPVIMIGGIDYNSKENNVAFSFDHLGVSFDLKELILHHQFYPIYINLDGFRLSGVRKKDDTYSFNIDQNKDKALKEIFNNINTPNNETNSVSNIKTLEEDKKSSTNNANDANFDMNTVMKKGIYQSFIDYRKQYSSLRLLKEVDFDDSWIDFNDEIKSEQYAVNFKKIKLTYDDKQNKLLVYTDISVNNKSLNKNIDISGSLINDASSNLFFNYSLEGIPPQLLLKYLSSYNLLDKTQIAGLEGNINISGRYKFKEGLKSAQAELDTNSGEVFTKGIVGDKVLVKSISTQVIYNQETGVVSVPKFDIQFDKNNKLAILAIKSNLYIREINLQAKLNVNSKIYNFNNIVLDNDGTILNGNINYSNDNLDFKFNSTDNIDVSRMRRLWPSNLAIIARNWTIEHVTTGIVNNVNVKGLINFANNNVNIKDISGSAVVNNATVRYVDGMPVVTTSKVNLTFDKGGLDINYIDGKTGSLITKQGEVKIFNENPNGDEYQSAILVNSNVEGSISDALQFINSKPLYLSDKAKLNIKDFSGNVAGNVKLEYSFTKSKVQNMNIELVSHGFGLAKAFKNNDVSNGDINLKIDDNHLTAYGNASYFNTPISLFIDIPWQDEIPYAVKIDADIKNIPLEKVKQLDLLPNFLNSSLFGSSDISLEIQNLRNSKQTNIQGNLDLINTELKNLPMLNYTKKAGVPLKALFNLSLVDNKLTTINQLNLSSSDLSAQLKLNFNNDGSTNVLINKFNINKKANIKGYLFLSDYEFNINLSGDYLDFGWVIDAIHDKSKVEDNDNNVASVSDDDKVAKTKVDTNNIVVKNNKTDAKSKNSDPSSVLKKNYIIKLNIKKAVNKDIVIKNLFLNLDLYDKYLNSLVMSGDLRNNKDVTIVYDKSHNQIALNIGNVEDILKFLNITNKIKAGSVVGRFDFKQDDKHNVATEGTLMFQKFSVGLVPFSSAKVSFVGNNYNFNIISLNLTGNVIGGDLSGKYLGEENYVELSGYVVPIWSTNYLVLQIPILGDILKSSLLNSEDVDAYNSKNNKKNKGFLNIPFKTYGDITNIKYEFGKGEIVRDVQQNASEDDNSSDESDGADTNLNLNNVIPKDDNVIGDPGLN